MQQVITAEQARKITGGRKPLVPLCYEEAVKALELCISIDDAKEWADKADAYAWWARMSKDHKLSRQARALRLEAFRRMGVLAAEIRPNRKNKGPGGRGTAPGPRSLLLESGLSEVEATAARSLARISQDKFSEMTGSTRPPSPTTAINNRWERGGWPAVRTQAGTFRAMTRKFNPRDLAKELVGSEIATGHAMAEELIEWLEIFNKALPPCRVDRK